MREILLVFIFLLVFIWEQLSYFLKLNKCLPTTLNFFPLSKFFFVLFLLGRVRKFVNLKFHHEDWTSTVTDNNLAAECSINTSNLASLTKFMLCVQYTAKIERARIDFFWRGCILNQPLCPQNLINTYPCKKKKKKHYLIIFSNSGYKVN